MFLEEFSQLAEILMEDCTFPLAVVGDFNFHLDTPNNQDALKFNDLLDSMNLVQHVKGSTHRHDHTLDLIITRREEKLIANVQVLSDVHSDHKVVSCTMNYSKPPPSKVLTTYRSTKKITKTHFYKSKIEHTNRNQLFRLIDGFFMLKNTVLPTYDSLEQLTEDFNNFFINKIRDIRKELSDFSDNTQLLHNMEKRNINCELSEFIPPSNKNIKDVITSFSNKTCALDPIPTHIVKGNINLLLPFISRIVRQSVATGVFPTSLKTSQARPKLKKPDFDPDLFVNYRPIANVPFLSKVIEKLVAI